MSEPVGDAELVARVVRGDASAFRMLYERHAESVYNVALRILRGSGRAADVTQEVFLRLHERGGEIKQPERVRAWLLRSSANLSIDWWRRNEPRGLEDHDPADAAPTPLDSLLAAEEQARLSEAIRQLSDPLREVVLLRYVEEASYQEIAELLELPMGTVKSRIYRAHEALVAMLEGPAGAEPATT